MNYTPTRRQLLRMTAAGGTTLAAAAPLLAPTFMLSIA